MRKRRVLAATVMAVSTMTTVVTAAPAQAKAMDWDNCPEGYVCLYGDTYGRGRYSNTPGTEKANVGAFINDLTSSIWNRTNDAVCFYEHTNWGGRTLIGVGPGEWVDNVGVAANDKISSYRGNVWCSW
ncbi:peptidase inhibitor family I36 protein [Streptosporangium sp. NPDC020072]|uniref:peptidase inhibitor family I36 protein n=1 Tax=Streptosporangium sp. NPDC020072 TaxID=3154788 RepID=UPI003436B554